MITLPPAHLAPLVGLRYRRNVRSSRDFTRRDPNEGPYSIFISYIPERVLACRTVNIHYYRLF